MPGIATSKIAMVPMTALLEIGLFFNKTRILSPKAATAILIQMENAKKLPT